MRPETILATVSGQRAGRRTRRNADIISASCHRVTVQDVAVLIPAHNEEAVLARTLDSAARLIPRNNIYVISDASTDRTVAIASDHGVSVIETAEKSGKAGALEEGVRRFELIKRYEAVLLLDADTQLDPGYFEYALPLFDDPDVAAIAGCAHTEWNPPGVSVLGKILISHRARIYAITQHLIKFGQTWRHTNALYIIPGFASMYRTRVLPHININPPGLVIEDFNMTFELYRRQLGRVGFTPRARAVTQDPDTFGDYVRQTKRWSLGFWQAVRRYRPRAGLFPVMLVLFVTELLVASGLMLLLPVIIVLSVLPSLIPSLLESPPFHLVHTQVDLRLILIAVLIPDLLLTIAVAVLERRPRYLLFAPAFPLLRMVDAAITLYALPRAWAERSTGSWASPQRRLSTNLARQLEGPPRLAYTADAIADTRIADEGGRLCVVARFPVQSTVGDEQGNERHRTLARLADASVSFSAQPIRGDEPDSSVAAPDPVPERFMGGASVHATAPGQQLSPRRGTSIVVSGRVAAKIVDKLREDSRSAVGAHGITIVIAEVVENVVDFAAQQVPGVHYAHTAVSRRRAASVQENSRDDPTRSIRQVTEIKIDLSIEYGFPVRTVTQKVREAVILVLRNLLDVDVTSVDIVVRDICFDHGDSPTTTRQTDGSQELPTAD
jgi:glycosyltransferase involved in cell wall biosynthesis/uncharacterized alkaline shock family protein YloU